MHVGDERFRNTIDNAGGDGTAEFVKQANVKIGFSFFFSKFHILIMFNIFIQRFA